MRARQSDRYGAELRHTTGFQPPETHDRRRWTAVYVGSQNSQAARMMTTEDGGGWHRRHAGCSLKDTAAPDHAGIGK